MWFKFFFRELFSRFFFLYYYLIMLYSNYQFLFFSLFTSLVHIEFPRGVVYCCYYLQFLLIGFIRFYNLFHIIFGFPSLITILVIIFICKQFYLLLYLMLLLLAAICAELCLSVFFGFFIRFFFLKEFIGR